MKSKIYHCNVEIAFHCHSHSTNTHALPWQRAYLRKVVSFGVFLKERTKNKMRVGLGDQESGYIVGVGQAWA
jgi:hypothetical protein